MDKSIRDFLLDGLEPEESVDEIMDFDLPDESTENPEYCRQYFRFLLPPA